MNNKNIEDEMLFAYGWHSYMFYNTKDYEEKRRVLKFMNAINELLELPPVWYDPVRDLVINGYEG